MRKNYLALCISLSFSSPAMACEIDTPTNWLPGMTRKQAEARKEEMLTAYYNVGSDERTENLVAGASDIYLARVIKSDPSVEKSKFSTVVEPLMAIKGVMPKSKILESGMPDSCGNPTGDGFGASAQVGELVVVFEGVGKSGDQARWTDSDRMMSILTGSLLDPVQAWLSKQPDYVPRE